MLTPSQVQDLRFKYGIKGTPQTASKESVVSRIAKDIPSDISETVVGAGKQMYDAGENIAERLQSKQTIPEKIIGTGADLFRGVGRSIGELFVGGAKALATPELEEKTKETIETVGEKVASSDIAQELATRYQSLTPEMKSQVDNILGYAEGLTSLVGAGKVLPTIGKASTQAVKDIASGVSRTTSEALSGIGKVGTEGIKEATNLGMDSAAIMQRVARIPKMRQAKFEETAGESVGQYLVKRGIFGDVDEISKKLYENFTKSKGTADASLEKLQGTYRARPVETALKELFEKEVRTSSPGALSADFKRVRELKNLYEKNGLTMSEINEVKRLYERNVRLDFVKDNATESVKRATNVDNALREWQFGKAKELGLKDLPELNKETRLAKQLLDDLGKEYAGSAGNNAVTLTDWILLSGGDPTAIAGFIAKKTFSSKKVMSTIAEKIAPESTFELPKGEIGEPIIDAYLRFLKSTEGRATQQ